MISRSAQAKAVALPLQAAAAANIWPLPAAHRPSLLDFPLMAPVNTAANLDKIRHGGAVFFGTGLVTPNAVGRGLPVDFMGMLLTAEWARRCTAGQTIHHVIADFHALADQRHDPAAIMAEALRQKTWVTQLANDLGLGGHYRCSLASEHHGKAAFSGIQAEVDALSGDAPAYFRHQSATTLYFARHENAACKIGWLVEDHLQPTGLDERSFDAFYDTLGLPPLAFVYTWCGWNFDPRRPRVSPYTSIAGEKRLMLDGAAAANALPALIAGCGSAKTARNAVLHLARIAAGFDRLFGSDLPGFWTDRRSDTPHVLTVNSKEPWVKGAAIDIAALAAQLDRMRDRDADAAEAELMKAVAAYKSRNALA